MGDLTRTIDATMQEAESRVRDALKDFGFGVLTEIDVARVFKDRLGVERAPLKILGACNPTMAHEAIAREPSAVLAIPCNVVLEAESDARTRVTIADPVQMMASASLSDLTASAREKLVGVIASLTR